LVFSKKKLIPKNCQKFAENTRFIGKAHFSEEIRKIAKYYHRKTHWFEHTHHTHVPKP